MSSTSSKPASRAGSAHNIQSIFSSLAVEALISCAISYLVCTMMSDKFTMTFDKFTMASVKRTIISGKLTMTSVGRTMASVMHTMRSDERTMNKYLFAFHFNIDNRQLSAGNSPL